MFASGFKPKAQPKFKSAVIGDYRLLALVGQGQFAQVYAAVHTRTRRLVAVKQTRHAGESISQEPLVMQKLEHPNIVQCQSISKTELGYQLVLEYCEGGTLRSHLASTLDLPSPLPLTAVKQLIGDILHGLGHIHQQGIVHGDLKPENIFITYRPQHSAAQQAKKTSPQLKLKIGDFGSARFSSDPSYSRKEIGSPTYAAPERFAGKSSPASDLYSVGIILYELLLGDRPFSGSPDELKRAHQTQLVPLPPTLTFAARQLLKKVLHKHPEQRFSTAAAMLSALQNLTSATTTSATTTRSQSSKHPIGLSHSTLNQVLMPIPSNGVMGTVEALLSIPQGCCIITERSLHMLTPKRKLISIARFTQPCWIAVSPNGKWFAAIAKNNNQISSNSAPKQQNKKEQENHQITTKSTRRHNNGILGYIGEHSGHRWRRDITLAGPLLTTLQAQVLQVIALDNRYLLRVSTTASKTYFECFTRRGQFIGEYTLDLPLVQVTPTIVPYQLMALSAPTQHTAAAVVLITLNPFQVRQIHLPIAPEQVNAFPWGYLVSHQRKGLLLDSSAQMACVLTGLPLDNAASTPTKTLCTGPAVQQGPTIAAINNQTILIANAKPSKATDPSVKGFQTSNTSSLLVADISKLDLGIIF